jgi:hypothetical protein
MLMQLSDKWEMINSTTVRLTGYTGASAIGARHRPHPHKPCTKRCERRAVQDGGGRENKREKREEVKEKEMGDRRR